MEYCTGWGRRVRFLTGFGLAVLSLLMSAPADLVYAAVLIVTDASDNMKNAPQGSLRRLLSECSPGDEIRFADSARAVTLEGAISLPSGANVTISGPATITQSATGGDRLFSVKSGANCTMRDLTLTGGVSNESGGAVVNAGTLTMERCALQGNTAAFNGGALSIENGGSTTILTDCTIADNRALGGGCSGGGIYIEAGTLTMTNCTVKNNENAFSGGGIFNMGTSTLTNCTIESNSADGFGGGIYHAGSTVLTLVGCTIQNNYCKKFGGGVCTVGGATSLVLRSRCVVNANAPDNIYGSYTSSGANFIGSSPNKSATAFFGYSGESEPEPRSIIGDADVAQVKSALADPESDLFAAVGGALSSDLGRMSGGTSATLAGLTTSLYYANTFENVGVESRDLVVEYTASWPENARYYALFRKADGSGYEMPERGIQFEIKAGQSLPDGATPPDFYEEGEGLMTWRNVVTDGGSFDLEPAAGVVTFRVCSVRAAEATGNTGGGCDASGGFAPLALLLLLPLWAFARSKGSIGK